MTCHQDEVGTIDEADIGDERNKQSHSVEKGNDICVDRGSTLPLTDSNSEGAKQTTDDAVVRVQKEEDALCEDNADVSSHVAEEDILCEDNAPCDESIDVKEELGSMKTIANQEDDCIDEDAAIRDALREGHRDSAPLSAAKLIQALKRARDKVDLAHRACTAAWTKPISLFDERMEQQARNRSVEDWAIGIVCKARLLVEEAADIYDLADVYQAQIQTAFIEKRGLDRSPLLGLLERCDLEAQRLETHAELLKLARDAFDHPDPSIVTQSSISSASVGPKAPTSPVKAVSGFSSSSSGSDAPVKIIRQTDKPDSLAKGIFQFFVHTGLDLLDEAGAAMGMNQDAPKAVESRKNEFVKASE